MHIFTEGVDVLKYFELLTILIATSNKSIVNDTENVWILAPTYMIIKYKIKFKKIKFIKNKI